MAFGQLGQSAHAVAEQAQAVVPAAARKAVDRAQRIGLEGDHHAVVPDGARQVVVPGARGRVSRRPAALVGGAAPDGLRAEHGEDRHGALRTGRVDQPAHLHEEVRPGEAPQPQALGLAGDLPDQVRLASAGLRGDTPATGGTRARSGRCRTARRRGGWGSSGHAARNRCRTVRRPAPGEQNDQKQVANPGHSRLVSPHGRR